MFKMFIKRFRSSLITAVHVLLLVPQLVSPCGNKVEIQELIYSNFHTFIDDQNYATIVYFYHPKCDSCKHLFEPFNVFASEISNWVSTGLVRLAKLNCENSENVQICKLFKISDYPFFMYFRPNLEWYPSGNLIQVNDSHHLHYYLTNIVVEKAEEYNFNINKIWPDLRPLKPKSKEDLFSLLPDNSNGKIVLFALEHTNKAFGMLSAKVILDSHQFKNSLVIVSVSGDEGLSRDPDYHVLNTEQQLNSFRLYQLIDKNSQKAEILIRKQGMWGIEQEQQLRTCINRFIRHRWIFQRPIERLNGSQVLNIIEEMSSLLEPNPGKRTFIEFLKVVIDYFPFSKEGLDKMKIIRIKLWLETNRSTLNTGDGLSTEGNVTGKIGSLCSLWSLYYTLVIGEYKTQSTNGLSAYYAKQDIFSLIEFQCEECITKLYHFMGQRIQANYRPESSLIWFWQVHNDMNKFIECDGYIDPQKTVETFPSKNQCPECFAENGTWIESKVHTFLISYFWPEDKIFSTVPTSESDPTDNIGKLIAMAFTLGGVILLIAVLLGIILFKIL